LLKKWKEKKAHLNMVTTEPHGNQKKDKEVDLQVITQGRPNIGLDLECGESSSQRMDEEIRNVVQPPP
jgi:hypothetical protein